MRGSRRLPWQLLPASWREVILFPVVQLQGLWQELRALDPAGPRARMATMLAVSTCLSTVAALALHLDYVWWAAISGYMCLQATAPSSLQRAILRVGGTIAGAILGFLVTPWLAYDHVAGSLFILTIATLGVLGYMLSSHSFAWLFAAITTDLIVLSSLQDPTEAFRFAFYRAAEVMVGSAAALVTAYALASDTGAAAPPAPGWSQLWGRDWPKLLHALRCGLTVMLLPWAWGWLYLPSPAQMSVTVAIIMAVPAFTDDPLESGRRVLMQSLQRLLGAFLGGLIGLALLATSVSEFLPWLAMLAISIWICGYVQTSKRGVGYVGTQAALGLIMTLVQGWMPPDSILPGLNRFGGMMAGLAVLFIVSFLLWPASPEPEPKPGSQGVTPA
jgi:uncharacterized membrane protein YccC